MVKIAQDKNHNGIIKVGHVDNIPFEDNTFDIVISKWALQLVEYIDPVYKEILRVLKPGGNLIYLSSSPIRQFLLKKSPKRNYFKKEIIKTSFFKGEITDFQPSHTLTEYLSPFFLSHFMLEEYDEGYYESSCENLSNDVYPMYFIMKARSIK